VLFIRSLNRKNRDLGDLITGVVRGLGYKGKHLRQHKCDLIVSSRAVILMLSRSRIIVVGGFNVCVSLLQALISRRLGNSHSWSSAPWVSAASDSLNSMSYSDRCRYSLTFPLLVDEMRCFNSHTGRVETIKRIVGVPRYPR